MLCRKYRLPRAEDRYSVSGAVFKTKSFAADDALLVDSRATTGAATPPVLNVLVPREYPNFQAKLLNPEMDDNSKRHSYYAASLCMFLSGWSYSDSTTFQTMLEHAQIVGYGNEPLECVDISVKNDSMFLWATAQVIRSGDGRLAIVVFRGTELTSVINWLTDATTEAIPAFPQAGIEVHAGFLRNFQALWPEIVKSLLWTTDASEKATASKQYPGGKWKELKALYICGHSLGGAMASLVPLTLYYSGHLPSMDYSSAKDDDNHLAFFWEKLRGVYTYGQPMAIRVHTDQKPLIPVEIENLIFRHVYDRDLFPHMPPRSTGNFCCVGREYRRRKGGMDEDDDWYLSKENSKQALSIIVALPIGSMDFIFHNISYLQWIPLPWSLADHSPWGYLESLSKYSLKIDQQEKH